MKRLATRAHAFVYRLTRGRLGGRVGGLPVLLLETTGRRTGRQRTTPVEFMRVDGAYVVVAANSGAPRPPAWYLNLRERPQTRVQLRDHLVAVDAHEALGDERAALWARLSAVTGT
jgi:deazaflavin-dependent oxidoreductase (nitroreductase family)